MGERKGRDDGADRPAATIDRARFGALLTTAARFRGSEGAAGELATVTHDAGAGDAGPLTRGEACLMVVAALDRSGRLVG